MVRGSKNEDSFYFGGFDLLVSMGTTGPTVRVPGMADCTLRSELLMTRQMYYYLTLTTQDTVQ